MKELQQSFQQETASRISATLAFDREDIAASAAALYLQYDDIVEARNKVSAHVADTWFLTRDESFIPSKEELNSGVLVFTTTAAYEAGALLPDHADDIASFYSEIGTAIIGQEVEIYTRGEVELHPLTTETSPQKKRSDRDRFHRKFEDMLSALESGSQTIFAANAEQKPALAAD